ncbi:actin filament-associated protein 1-like 2 isoform X3 [Gouania willdenowi]|uniref:actin filament-associated protein 1-like 2 isoform X3 n=1 Tax=Gouania willdenowi TaxID=441366 RepID=UPI0010550B87|nr:actin filament-associated protein 1-like 2 isoform X3 [Gouania willdenowi]
MSERERVCCTHRTDMDKHKVLEKLLYDLQNFLLVLDSENLSYIAQSQKKSVSEMLLRLQSVEAAVEDAEYMIMSCQSSSFPSNEQTETPETEDVLIPTELGSDQDTARPRNEGPVVPPLPSSCLGNDEDTYEEAEPYMSTDVLSPPTVRAETDSSHYESYGEDEDEGTEPVKDRAHYIQWSASQPCLRPTPEWRLCGYLWRRRWLGQWTKQLFIIRDHSLLCYKCAQDLLPQLELKLHGVRIVSKHKHNKKVQHVLKVVTQRRDELELGFSSAHQAEEWRRVLEEVSNAGDFDLQSVSSLNRSEMMLYRSSSIQTDSEEEKLSITDSNNNTGLLSVLMNCQWQSLWCRVDEGTLSMFSEEQHDSSPQYTVPLHGCDISTDTGHAHRITLSMFGDHVAVLEVSSSEEKHRWLKKLRDEATHRRNHDNSRGAHTGEALSGLQCHRFPTSNTYMDQHVYSSTAAQEPPLYSNTSILEHMDSVHGSSSSCTDSVTYRNTFLSTHNRKLCEVKRGVQKLDLTGRRPGPGWAGSETNLSSAAKQNKRTFRQSLAVCTERAQAPDLSLVQAGFLNPLLRRTASAKVSLNRAPSALFIEHENVFHRRKEWENKTTS